MSPMLRTVTTLFVRGLTLRCPRCGKTKLFQHGLTMYERCAYCGWVFEREEGYWTGAMGVNLIISELIVAVVVIPLAAAQVPLLPLIGFGIPCAALLPILFYRHAKSFWMTFDFLINPVALQ